MESEPANYNQRQKSKSRHFSGIDQFLEKTWRVVVNMLNHFNEINVF